MKTVFMLVALEAWILCAGSPSFACSSLKPTPTEEQMVKKSSAIFVGHLIRAEERQVLDARGDWPNMVDGSFTLMETLKGRLPVDHKVNSLAYGLGNCSLPLLVGNDYIFFLENNNIVMMFHGNAMLLVNIKNENTQKESTKLRKLVSENP